MKKLLAFLLLISVSIVSVSFLAACKKETTEKETTKYAAKFVGGEGATGTAPQTRYKAKGQIFILPENTFEKEDYVFAGWSDGAETYDEGGQYTMPAHNVTFTATWNENQTTYCTATFNILDGTGTTPEPITAIYNNTIIMPESNGFSKEGFRFTGWMLEATRYMPGSTHLIVANVTFVADWSMLYSVTFDLNGADEGTISPIYAIKDENISLPDGTGISKAGKTLNGWTCNYDTKTYGPGTNFSMPESDVIFTAIWQDEYVEPTSYTVTYSAGSGTGSVPTDGNTYNENATVEILHPMTLTNNEFEMLYWESNSDAIGYQPGSQFTMPAQNVTFTAIWGYKVTFADGGADSGTVPATIYLTEDSETFEITLPSPGSLLKDGYTFAGWDTDGNGSADLTENDPFAVIGTITIVAIWE